MTARYCSPPPLARGTGKAVQVRLLDTGLADSHLTCPVRTQNRTTSSPRVPPRYDAKASRGNGLIEAVGKPARRRISSSISGRRVRATPSSSTMSTGPRTLLMSHAVSAAGAAPSGAVRLLDRPAGRGRAIEQQLGRGAGEDAVGARPHGAQRAALGPHQRAGRRLQQRPSRLTNTTSSTPRRSASRSAAMFTAYDSVFTPPSSHGASAKACRPRAARQADHDRSPRRRCASERAPIGSTVIMPAARPPLGPAGEQQLHRGLARRGATPPASA